MSKHRAPEEPAGYEVDSADFPLDGGFPEQHPGELALLIEDADGGGGEFRPRRRRQGGARPRWRSPLGVVLALVVVAGLVFGIFYGGRAILSGWGDTPDYTGNGTGSVNIRVKQGDTASDIAVTLKDADVVKSARAFTDAAEENPDAAGIQPGLYAMRKQMKASAALDLMLDPASRLVHRLTVPEGLTQKQIFAKIVELTKVPLAELEAAAKDTANLGLPDWAKGKLEGLLFPSTYDFDPESDALSILQTMVAKFVSATAELDLNAGKGGKSPYQLLIMASMIEKEAKFDEDRPKVSRVIYNRLAQDMQLQIDATLAYGLNKPGNKLTTDDLKSDNPYNTYTHKSLPPTPIASPGLESLQAALAPAEGPWIFYVRNDAEGHHFFTEDEAAFAEAKEKCVANNWGCG